MSNNEIIKKEVEDFVSGYIAGSCVSFDEALTTFVEWMKSDRNIILTPTESEVLLIAEIEATEIFLCGDCGWWCWAHEASYRSADCCSECAPNEEEENE